MRKLACPVLSVLALDGCSRAMPEDKLLDILNQRAALVAHVGKVKQVEVLSTAKAAARVDGSSRYSCEVRLLQVTGQKGRTYVSYMRRETPQATDSALTWSDDREAANGQLGRLLSEHCSS